MDVGGRDLDNSAFPEEELVVQKGVCYNGAGVGQDGLEA